MSNIFFHVGFVTKIVYAFLFPYWVQYVPPISSVVIYLPRYEHHEVKNIDFDFLYYAFFIRPVILPQAKTSLQSFSQIHSTTTLALR